MHSRTNILLEALSHRSCLRSLQMERDREALLKRGEGPSL